MPNGRSPAPSTAAAGSAPSAGAGSPSGGVPGIVSPPRPARPAIPARPAALGSRAAWARSGLDPRAAEYLLADLVPFLPSPWHLQHAAHQVLVTVVGAHRLRDRDPLRRAVDDLGPVAGRDGAFGQHPQVHARPAGRGEPLHPVRLVHPGLERDAGNPRAGDLDDGVPIRQVSPISAPLTSSPATV